jgi:hypothetical protein
MRPKWVPHYGVQAASGHAQDTQALLRLCSGMLTSAQVKAAVAQVRRLKRNQRKGKFNPESRGILPLRNSDQAPN